MRQTLVDLAQAGYSLPAEVDPMWLTLGNVRTDLPTITPSKKVPWWRLAVMMWQGITCINAEHPAHAMRCRSESVPTAYAEMCAIIERGFKRGCDASLDWETRALAFGSMLHTLQDSYCTAHCSRLDNSNPTSPIVDMHTYPSRHHPLTTSRDAVWQDKAQTAFKPYAAAAISASVVAMRFFVAQSVADLPEFMATYLAFQSLAD